MKKENQNLSKEQQEQERNNFFDKIIKENIAQVLIPLINQLLGLELEAKNLEEITESLQTAIERKPDLLRKIVAGSCSAV